jgi:predicted MFS family arabinose efflux permease
MKALVGEKAVAPQVRGGWPAVGAVTLGAFSLITLEFLPVGLLPEIADSLRISEGTAGLMVTAPGLAAAVAAPVVVVGLATWDRRRLLLGLALLLVVSAVVGASAQGFVQMLVARILLGVGIGGFWAVGPGIGMRLVDPSRAGRASAWVLAGVSVGTVVGLPVGTAVGHLVGWRASFGLAGGVGLIALLAQLVLVPPLAPTVSFRPGDLLDVTRFKTARAGLVLVVLVFVGHFAGYTYITPYLEQDVGLGPSAITILLLAYGAAGVVGNFVFSAFAERALRVGLAVAAATVGIGSLLTLLLQPWPTAAGGSFVLWGFAFGGLPLLLQTWMFRSISTGSEGGAALFVSTLQLSVATGALVGGIVLDISGFGLVLALTVASAALVLLFLTFERGPGDD